MSDDDIYQRLVHLSPDERQLLLTALSTSGFESQHSMSNNQAAQGSNIHGPQHDTSKDAATHDSKLPATYLDHGLDATGFDSNLLFDQNGQLMDGSLLGAFPDGGYDYENFDNSAYLGEMPSPGVHASGDDDVAQRASVSDSPSDEPEGGEKRKSSNDDGKDSDGKKRRGDGTAKKPGRKPLTTEPTSKRKAQNRAAQRAFRERKEKHLKDLETKVEILEKASKDSHQENSLLRAQVARLQIELQEYRKRLSWVNDDTVGRTSFGGIPRDLHSSTNSSDFFFGVGSMPQAGLNSAGSSVAPSSTHQATKTSSQYRQSSWNASPATAAPYTSQNGILSYTMPHPSAPSSRSAQHDKASSTSTGVEPLNTQKTVPSTPSTTTTTGSVKSAGQSKLGSPTSCCELVHSNSNTSSPGSSLSATLDSPLFEQNQVRSSQNGGPSTAAQHDPSQQHHKAKTHESGAPITQNKSFSDNMLNGARQADGAEFALQQYTDQASAVPDFDWYVQQNHGAFDPALFSDYREPQDAYLSHDLDSFLTETPFGILGNDSLHDMSKSAQQTAPDVDEDEKALEAACKTTATDEYQKNVQVLLDKVNEFKRCKELELQVAPACMKALEQMEGYLTLSDVWTRVTQAKKFKEGEINVEELCSEFQSKACCSDAGLLMNAHEVDKIMTRYE